MKWRGFFLESWYYKQPRTLFEAVLFFVRLPLAFWKWRNLSDEKKRFGIRQFVAVRNARQETDK